MPAVPFRGFKFDPRTIAMIRWAEKQLGQQLDIAQGSYNAGGVAASAGAHDQGGAVDFSVRQMLPETRVRVLRVLKEAGFAAWYRTDRPGVWGPHIHAIAIGCGGGYPGKGLSRVAAQQVHAYDQGKDGLAANGPDDTYRPEPPVQFSLIKRKPVPRKTK